jgi:hypothetical protein
MMKKSKGKNISPNTFFDSTVTDHVYAYFKDGKYYYFDDPEQEVRFDYDQNLFPEGILVKMVVSLNHIPDTIYTEINTFKSESKILDAGSVLTFELPYNNAGSSVHFFIEVKLIEELKIIKMGKKLPKLSSCQCVIINIKNRLNKGESLIIPENSFSSLNQLYTQTSIQLRPTNKSHTCNVFTTFKLPNGKLLDSLR